MDAILPSDWKFRKECRISLEVEVNCSEEARRKSTNGSSKQDDALRVGEDSTSELVCYLEIQLEILKA